MDVVIGLDCGTSATKAVAAALDGKVRATASEAYPLLVPAPGRAELDPVVLQAAVVRALAAVAAEVQARGDHVVAVCLSAAMHGTLPMGEDGGPLVRLDHRPLRHPRRPVGRGSDGVRRRTRRSAGGGPADHGGAARLRPDVAAATGLPLGVPITLGGRAVEQSVESTGGPADHSGAYIRIRREHGAATWSGLRWRASVSSWRWCVTRSTPPVSAGPRS